MYVRLMHCRSKGRSLALARGLLKTLSTAPQPGNTVFRETSVPFEQPAPDDHAPNVSEEVKEIAERISKLTLVDIVSLNKLLKHKFNLPDSPVVMQPGIMTTATSTTKAEMDRSAESTQKTSFTVRLTGFDEKKKIALIKEVKTLVPGMNLVQAKKFVESLPQTIREDVGKSDAEKLQQQLEAVGGQCTIE